MNSIFVLDEKFVQTASHARVDCNRPAVQFSQEFSSAVIFVEIRIIRQCLINTVFLFLSHLLLRVQQCVDVFLVT